MKLALFLALTAIVLSTTSAFVKWNMWDARNVVDIKDKVTSSKLHFLTYLSIMIFLHYLNEV